MSIAWFCIDYYLNLYGHIYELIVYFIGVIYRPIIKKNRLKTIVCRVLGPGHTANMPFFAVCRDRAHGKAAIVCRVKGPGHTANRMLT